LCCGQNAFQDGIEISDFKCAQNAQKSAELNALARFKTLQSCNRDTSAARALRLRQKQRDTSLLRCGSKGFKRSIGCELLTYLIITSKLMDNQIIVT
jgi:hypothetical protein